MASFIEIKLEAIGLFDFTGCSWSFSLSIKSLNIYTQEEIAQKEINAIATFIHKFIENIFIEKIKGTMTTKFLI